MCSIEVHKFPPATRDEPCTSMLFEHGAPSRRSEPEEPEASAKLARSAILSAADQPASSPEAQAQCRLNPPHAASTSSASPTT